MDTLRFNAQELCSRKLWQMVATPTAKEINDNELAEAVNELAARRHYLSQLQEIGKLADKQQGS